MMMRRHWNKYLARMVTIIAAIKHFSKKVYCQRCREIIEHEIALHPAYNTALGMMPAEAYKTCRKCGKRSTYSIPSKKWGALAFLLGILLFTLSGYVITSYPQTGSFSGVFPIDLSFLIFLTILLLPGITLLIAGFRELFPARSLNVERIYPTALKILGIYLGVFGLFLLIGNLLALIAEGGNTAATITTLICAGIVLVGINVYNRGKKLSSE